MAYPDPVGSNRAGVEERSSKHRSVGVERDVELLSCDFARAAAIFDSPTFRRSEPLRVTFAQLAGTRAVAAGRVEPNRDLARIEREGGSGHRAAPGPRTLASHAGET